MDKKDIQGNISKIKILKLIRDKQEITRTEIINLSGLSAPTVTRVVESLVQSNLIQTIGVGTSIGGRRPQIIQFNAKNNYVIGIDLGGTYIRSALSNLDGEFIFEIQVPTQLNIGFDGVMEQVGQLIDKLSARAKQNKLSLCGIGIAVCGMVNKKTKIVEYSPIFNWQNVDVIKALTKYTSLTIAIGNVVQLIAMGELMYGLGRGYSNFISINMGYGIGSGIIVDRKLFGGADGIAGEIGHIVVDRNSERKGLEGVKGTLEALASGYGIADVAKTLAKLDPLSLLNEIGTTEIDAKHVFDAAEKGDKLANSILENAAHSYCIGIDALIKLFNTECIILSGGLIQYSTLLLDKIKANMSNYSMQALSRKVPIESSAFAENAGLMGSFSLILEKVLSLEQETPI